MGLLDSLFGRAKDDEAAIQDALRRLDFARYFDSEYREYCAPDQIARRDALAADALKLLKRNGWTDARRVEFFESKGGRLQPAYDRNDFEKFIGGWFVYRSRLENAYYEELKDLRLSTSQLHDALKAEGWAEGEINRFLMRFSPGGRAAYESIQKAGGGGGAGGNAGAGGAS